MAYPMTLPVGSVLSLNTYDITEHNRSPIEISHTIIEKSKMMASGQTRRFVIAQKKRLQVSWSLMPSSSSMTVDGKYGALDLRNLYVISNGTFTVQLKYRGSIEETISMYATDASFEVVKRNVKATVSSSPQELWNVSLTLEEI